VITKSPATPTGPFETGTAPGIWTLDQQMQFKQQGVWPTAGLTPNYIEDMFSTYLYTGTGASQTITNGIDLSTKGGLVWIKSRGSAVDHALADTVRGANNRIASNNTAAQIAGGVTAFNTNGFNIDNEPEVNSSSTAYASWTFREQPKFFDIVTYTGTGAVQNIAHNLGSVPGCIIVKTTNATTNWIVQHRSSGGGTQRGLLNSTSVFGANSTMWDNTNPTSSVFTVGTNADTNQSGNTFVAYLFAHDAGGFGLTGTDNVISCGSYTGVGSTQQDITLGYEPQWVMIKRTDIVNSWVMVDNMRGFFQTADNALCANNANAEAATVSVSGAMQPIATGFHLYNTNSSVNASGGTYIYIACRRGPMKVPTLGTSVFGLNASTGTGANATVTGGAGVSDAVLVKNRGAAVGNLFAARLTGTGYLATSSRAAEVAAGTTILQANPWDVMNGVKVGTTSTITNASANTFVNYLFSRAPGFFDVVAYTGTGSTTTIAHNLGAAPELIIVKSRSNLNTEWNVYAAPLGATKYLWLQATNAQGTGVNRWNDTAPTSSVFTVATDTSVNGSGYTLVAYLFATVAGVSKVGGYTGTGTTQVINCGFTAGSRFVLIKRTDSTGDWYVWDSARGIIAGNDPYLLLNSTAAEVTSTDYIDTYSAGFEISSTAPAAINASAGSFIFLAIA